MNSDPGSVACFALTTPSLFLHLQNRAVTISPGIVGEKGRGDWFPRWCGYKQKELLDCVGIRKGVCRSEGKDWSPRLKEGGAQSGESGSLFSALPQQSVSRPWPSPGGSLSQGLPSGFQGFCPQLEAIHVPQGGMCLLAKARSILPVPASGLWASNEGESCPRKSVFPDTFPLHVRLFKINIYLFACAGSSWQHAEYSVVAYKLLSCSVWGPGTLTRDGTQAPCTGSVEP